MSLIPWRWFVPASSSMAHLFGVGIYGQTYFPEYPWAQTDFRDRPWFPLVKAIHRGLSVVSDIERWVRVRTVRRHHIVKLPLHPGWHDLDQRMYHAVFALLGEYVEQELGPATIDMDDAETYYSYRLHSSDSDIAAIDLWRWYRLRYPEICRTIYKVRYEDREALFVEMDEKFMEVVRLRHTFWT